jgi:gluconate 2-dehydrogenase gamma chain
MSHGRFSIRIKAGSQHSGEDFMTVDQQGGRDRADAIDGVSRRSFLQTVSGALGGTLLTLEWSDIAAAVHAHSETVQADNAAASFLTPAELADVDAIAAQIIPTDDTPGAREAGVAGFIDRGLATFLARFAPTFRVQLDEFRAKCRARHPDAAAFAALSSGQQIEFLKTVETTPFFERMRLLTVLGMFTLPRYGGNRDAVGWRLLGFQDQHIFVPPFGHYDRDYPGFAVALARQSAAETL